MTDKIVAFSTCATEEEAVRLARALVETRVAACVTIVPGARSIYRWQGKVEESAECLLMIKSSLPDFEALRQTLEKTHSYEVPELLALQVAEGAPRYMRWLEGELGH
ncbi:MAG: divalent-cation tolerance protein CutA [Bryobacteraceae bacterium]